jgi:hypothetical protein
MQLLVHGGDARIALNEDNLNRYGCAPFPGLGLIALGSSTATGISPRGYAAADALRDQLALACVNKTATAIYAREMERVRKALLGLCGIADLPGLEVVFAASGTDLHLIAVELVSTGASAPTLAITVDSCETGRGVPLALARRNFSSRAALGDELIEGEAIPVDGAASDITVVTVPLRLIDGTPRAAAEVDLEFTSRADIAAATGQRVLLVLTDVSKTGIIAPTPSCILALQRRWPHLIDVLADACQFRVESATLRAYLQQGFMVALTGSKFVTGPPFSGALLLPAAIADKLRQQPLPRTLAAYSAPADWPRNWNISSLIDSSVNFGLLLRWQAALVELSALHAVPAAEIKNFLQEFAASIRGRLAGNPIFQALEVPALNRAPVVEHGGWDHIQTIFPFLLFNSSSRGMSPLNREQTMAIYQALQLDASDADGDGNSSAVLASRYQLGQPVACGHRAGIPVSAMRLCVSARMVVEAMRGKGGPSAVIDRALAALDKTALLVGLADRDAADQRLPAIRTG